MFLKIVESILGEFQILKNSQVKMTEIFIQTIPNNTSTQEKANIWVQRYRNSYFIDQELNLHVLTVPLIKVTKELQNKQISRDQKAKHKKLAWALYSQEEACKTFQERLE